MKIDPLLEARALFFNHVNPGEWDSMDIDEVKKRVYGNLAYYIEFAYPHQLLDAVLAEAWKDGLMDRPTSNYLFWLIHRQRGSTDQKNYGANLFDVNYDFSERILYDQLPKWKRVFAANGHQAIDVLGDAYATPEGRARIAQANRARTFAEYLRICRE